MPAPASAAPAAAASQAGLHLFASASSPACGSDPGAGHETTFCALLYCLAKLGVVEREDAQALVTRVFARYLQLMRKIQVGTTCGSPLRQLPPPLLRLPGHAQHQALCCPLHEHRARCNNSPSCARVAPAHLLTPCDLNSPPRPPGCCQTTYWLEPAGSHGVWGLDDYQFLPFVWGSAQVGPPRGTKTGPSQDGARMPPRCGHRTVFAA